MSHQELNIQLFISTQCPHCASTLELLSTAIKQGTFSQLSITNISAATKLDAYSHIRSVPHTQVNNFEFTGTITTADIKQWDEAAKQGAFEKYYIEYLLSNGKLIPAEKLIQQESAFWLILVELIENHDTKMQVRIGISSIFETLSSGLLTSDHSDAVIQRLMQAISNTDNSIRVDLIYLLSLIFTEMKHDADLYSKLCNFLRLLLTDPSEEVKEIIYDVLQAEPG